VVATQTGGADWVFDVRSRGDSAGQTIDASADTDMNVLTIKFGGSDAMSEFDLLVARVDQGSVLEFASNMVSVPNGATLTVNYGAFNADGASLPMGIDADGDGIPENTMVLADMGSGGIGPSSTSTPPPAHGGCAIGGSSNAPWALLLLVGIGL